MASGPEQLWQRAVESRRSAQLSSLRAAEILHQYAGVGGALLLDSALLGDVVAGAVQQQQQPQPQPQPQQLPGHQRLSVAPGAYDMGATPQSQAHERAWRAESGALEQRLGQLKEELYRRNDMMQQAEAARRKQEADAARMRQQEADAQAAVAARAAREQQRQKERRAEAAAASQARRAEEAAQRASERSVSDLVDIGLERRRRFAARVPDVDVFSKKYRKMVKPCKLMIQMTSETVNDFKLGFVGRQGKAGAGGFLTQLRAHNPDLMEKGMHVVAEALLDNGTSNTAPDSLKAGETKFALVYLAVTVAAKFDGFFEVLMEALNFHCPFTCPGMREAIAARAHRDGVASDKIRAEFGYKSGESNGAYIARMQAFVSFQAGLFQTSMAMLAAPPFTMVPVGTPHPCARGGLVEAWRWLASTLNRPPSRWTPYLVQAFAAVAGFELSRHFSEQTPKLAALLASDAFMQRCRAAAVLDVKLSDNDVDRLNTFAELATKVHRDLRGRFPAPGKPEEGEDIRQLVLDVARNDAV